MSAVMCGLIDQPTISRLNRPSTMARYACVLIGVPTILLELALAIGFTNTQVFEVRKMRSSARQGGSHHLRECIVELSR